TTEAMMKRENRRCEVLLLSAERFLCVARRFGLTYPKRKLRKLWKKLLFNQVHDNLDGTSIEAVYQDAATDYKQIRRSVSRMEHLEAIAKHIDTSGGGTKAVIVFNPLSWRRKSIAEVSMTEIPKKNFHILDQNGAEVPFQIVEDEGEEKLIFTANVPALGYRVYHLRPTSEKPTFETDLKVDERTLENAHFRVEVYPELNYAVNIFDKRNNRTVFDPSRGGNILEIYEDKPPQAPDGEPAWNIYLGSRSEPKALKARLVERGPIRAKIRIERKIGHSSFIQDVTLYAEAPQVDFELHIDWHENYRFAKAAFPLNLVSYWATYEIPYGVIQRYDHSLKKSPPADMQIPRRGWETADTAKWEVSAQRWVDVSSLSTDYGISLLNDSKYGFSFENNTLRMSLVRGPRRGYRSTPESWADQSDMPRVGIHHIKYAIYPHKGDWRTAGTVRKGYEFNYPLQLVLDDPHDGELPPQHSFIEISPENVILTAIKEAEDSRDLIVRMYEAHGVDTEAEIKFDIAPSKVWQTDLIERDKYLPKVEYEIKGNSVSVPMAAWEIKTLKVQYLSQRRQN
ncbi:MAG: glycoside hydrolase family 38 C-terminal domain-containing protein, partial [Candidatus Bathyarchaeia archaeon]